MSLRGVGIGLRRAFARELLTIDRSLDWLEVVPENFLSQSGPAFATLMKLRERWPMALHGVALSVCGSHDIRAHAARLHSLAQRVEPALITDHLCLAELSGEPIFDLVPVPRTEAFVAHTATRIDIAADVLERPLSFENITTYAAMPGSVLSEGEFVSGVLREANAGLLLDVNNLYLNGKNLGQNPLALLTALPLERVTQIHIAGHVHDGTRLLDTHSRPVCVEVWDLYREALRRVGPVPVLLEWDQDIPSLNAVLDEADKARAILHEVCGAAQ
jgi:uncharacterized protein